VREPFDERWYPAFARLLRIGQAPIPVEIDDAVIDVVVAPHYLVVRCGRECHRTVVTRIIRVIAPAVMLPQWPG